MLFLKTMWFIHKSQKWTQELIMIQFHLDSHGSDDSTRWINAMEEEYLQVKIKFAISLNCLNDVKSVVVNGSLRPSLTQMAILRDIKPNLLAKTLLRKMILIIKETFSSVSRKDSSNHQGFGGSFRFTFTPKLSFLMKIWTKMLYRQT